MVFARHNKWSLLGSVCAVLILLSARTAYSVTVGSKFPIATTAQPEVSIGAAFDGTNYLVGIQGDNVHHASVGAQLVDQSGTLVGSLITTGRTGGAPVVAFDGTNYMLVWTDDANHPNDDIYGCLISPSGDRGAIFLISQAPGKQEVCGIAFDGTNYLIVWEDYRNDLDEDGECDPGEGTCTDIYAQFVTKMGSLPGPEIPVSTQVESQKQPGAAFDGTRYLVAWSSKRDEPGELWDIWGRFVTTAGVLSDPFLISETASPRYNPTCVTFGETDYLVTWNKDMGPGYPSPSDWDMYGRIVLPTGGFLSSEFPISQAPGSQLFPRAAYDGHKYLVIWTDFGNDADSDYTCDPGEGTCADVLGQFLSTTGAPAGPVFVVNNDAYNQFGLSIVFGADRFLVGIGQGDVFVGPSDMYGVFVSGAPVYFVRISDLQYAPTPPNPIKVCGRVTSEVPLVISDGNSEIEVAGITAELGDFVIVEGDWDGSVLTAN